MDEPSATDEHLSRLMARAQDGDHDAYVTLLRAITPWVRRTVRGKRGFFGDQESRTSCRMFSYRSMQCEPRTIPHDL